MYVLRHLREVMLVFASSLAVSEEHVCFGGSSECVLLVFRASEVSETRPTCVIK